MAKCAPLRVLSDEANLLREAELAPSSTLPIAAENSVFRIPASRAGNAGVTISGDYTGAEDASLDIEIVDAEPDTELASVPVYSGSGTGRMVDVASVGLGAQTIDVDLKENGTPTTHARLSFEGVTLVAVKEGEDGNAVSLDVDQSPLVFAPTNFSLLVNISAGAGGTATGLKGSAFDWDTKVRATDGSIPLDAHRVAFGDDEGAIYLAYKEFVQREWLYYFVPAIQRDIAAGTPVRFVTEGRTVTITDASESPPVVETYADCATVYDFLHQVKEQSAVVTIDGVVANDRTPSGQAARELLVRTDARTDASTGSGSEFATGVVNAFANDDAATELVTIKCYAASASDHPLAALGSERWEVTGSLSGKRADAITGVPYVDDKFGFLIPRKFPPGFGTTRGRFSVAGIIYATRTEAQPEPPICPVLFPLGPEAINQTLTLTYARRPSGTCDCSDMPVQRPDARCLGVDTTEGGSLMSYSLATRTRLIALRDWFAELVRDNSTHGARGQNATYDQPPLISNPIGRHASEFGLDERIIQVEVEEHGDIEGPNTTTDPSTSSTQGTTANGRLGYGWGVLTTGLAGGIYAVDFRGAYVVTYTPFEIESLKDMVDRFELALADIDALPDGAESPDPKADGMAAWDTAVEELQSDVEAQLHPPAAEYSLFGNVVDPVTGVNAQPSEAITNGDVVLVYLKPGTVDELLVRKWVPGIAGAAGYAAADGDATSPPTPINVRFSGSNIHATADADIVPGSLYGASTATPGSYAADAATPKIGVGVVGGTPGEMAHDITRAGLTVTAGGSPNRLAILADRYRSRIAWALISAGISPLGKSSASTLESGDGCWRDFGDAYWWEVEGSESGGYAPAFTNHAYVGSRLAVKSGKYFSTHEFGFQINVKCPQDLVPGDQIRLVISDAGWGATYRVGDVLFLPLIAAGALALAGGLDGDNVQRWFVTSSLGPLPVYELDPDAPLPYSSGTGLSFLIEQGGIAFAQGDRFRFALVGGHWKWRVNGGAWQSESPPLAITDAAMLFYEGLSVRFDTGAAPCFVAGDRHSFLAVQPWASSNVRRPGIEVWKWSGADASLVWDMGAAQDIRDFAIALHTLPEGATITLEGGAAPGVWDWSEELTRRAGVIFAEFEPALSARYLRLTVANAAGGAIGWVAAGEALTTSLSADASLALSYKVQRAESGLARVSRYLGKAISGEISWQPGALSEADVASLASLLDWIKEHDDEPVVIVPNVSRPNEAFLGHVAVDAVEFPDMFTWGPNADKERRHSMSLPIAGVWQ